MKILKAILFLATIIVAVQFPFTSKSENKQNPSDNFIDGEILVKFKAVNPMNKSTETLEQRF